LQAAAALQDNDIIVEPVRLGHIATYIAEDQMPSVHIVSYALHLLLLSFVLKRPAVLQS
jgi:hypothetical protein